MAVFALYSPFGDGDTSSPDLVLGGINWTKKYETPDAGEVANLMALLRGSSEAVLEDSSGKIRVTIEVL